jgi:PIN domain-containing protein
MGHPVYLIDFENVRTIDLSPLAPGARVLIFVGRSQNSIPFSLATTAQRLGSNLEWVKIEGDGKNNLDFHIAFHLGRLATEHPDARFFIVSKDKGFDALIRHVQARQIRCQRIDSVSIQSRASAALTPIAAPADDHFLKAFAILNNMNRQNRPRRRKTLLQQVASTFQKKLPAEETLRIVDLFFAKGLVTETNNTLAYTF